MFTKCVLSILEVNLNQHLRDKKFVIICSRCPHNCKTAHFTSWKTPEGLWDVQKWKMHVRHMQNYQFSLSNMQICDVLSLSWMLSSQILNTVAKHITSKNKRNVECCGRRCWMEIKLCSTLSNSREPKQPWRRRQQKPHKFAYLTMKNSIFARFARAFFIFWHFVDVLVLSTTWNDQFCSWVDDISIWWQMFNCVFLCPKRRFQLNFRIVRTHFSSIMSLNNWKMIAETRSYIFRWRSRFRRRRDCLSSLVSEVMAKQMQHVQFNVIGWCWTNMLNQHVESLCPGLLR